MSLSGRLAFVVGLLVLLMTAAPAFGQIHVTITADESTLIAFALAVSEMSFALAAVFSALSKNRETAVVCTTLPWTQNS